MLNGFGTMNAPPIVVDFTWHREDITRMMHHLSQWPDEADISFALQGDDEPPLALVVRHPRVGFTLWLPAVRGWLSDAAMPDAPQTASMLAELLERRFTSTQEILAPRARAAVLARCAVDPAVFEAVAPLQNADGDLELDWFEWDDGLELVCNNDASIVFDGSNPIADDLAPMPFLPCDLDHHLADPGSSETIYIQPCATEDEPSIISIPMPSALEVMTEIARRNTKKDAA